MPVIGRSGRIRTGSHWFWSLRLVMLSHPFCYVLEPMCGFII